MEIVNKHFFQQSLLFQFLLGVIDFCDIVMLHSEPNSCCQQNLECFYVPLLSLGLFL